MTRNRTVNSPPSRASGRRRPRRSRRRRSGFANVSRRRSSGGSIFRWKPTRPAWRRPSRRVRSRL